MFSVFAVSLLFVTRFTVLSDEMNYHETCINMELPLFIWGLSHLYYNWCGSVRAPHVVKYADKLANQAATCYEKKQPCQHLKKTLHYI